MHIVPMRPFEVVQISSTYKVRRVACVSCPQPSSHALAIQVFAFPTEHRVTSQGYAVVSSRRGALFPQYAGCDREEIIELRKQKVRVYGEDDVVELVYSGDSTLQGLLAVPEKLNDFLRAAQFSGDGDNSAVPCHPVLQSINLDFVCTAELLIMEMTYLDGEADLAASRGHVHLQDLVTHAHMFSNR